MLFDVDGINRLLHDEKMMKEVFGNDGFVHAQDISREPDSKQKYHRIRQLHQSVLSGNGKAAKFYLPFKLKATSGQILYDLIFLTNNDRGFEVMKDAMWKADKTGGVQFVDSEYDELTFNFQTAPDELWQLLSKEFSGKRVSGMEVDKFVRFKTRFRRPDKTQALKNHEADRCPSEQKIKVTSRPQKGTYPDGCEILFP